MMKNSVLVILLLLSFILSSREVAAHEVRPTYLEISETAPNCFDILWKQPTVQLQALRLQPMLSNGLLTGPFDEQYAARGFVIRRWTNRRFARDDFDGATVRIDGLEHTITDTLVNIRFSDGSQILQLIKPSNPSFVIHLTRNHSTPIAGYITLGIRHILFGFDHLSFVLGLVLLVRGRLRLVTTVTAFTLGHSITLGSSVLGYAQLPSPSVIEALVALSILFVAMELARSWDGYEGITSRHPSLVASSFGLLHGFAFAGSLANIGLPAQNIPTALLLFNCGVEIGQMVFIGFALTTTAILSQCEYSVRLTRMRWLVPYGIGIFACYWAFERIGALIA